MIALDDFLAATSAEMLDRGLHATFEGFAHDSRTVQPGDWFVAVRGMHGDGHDYATDAIERGAHAVLLEHSGWARLAATVPDARDQARRAGVTVLLVADTRRALQQYAGYILTRWGPVVVAVTGATGKTTTKEAVADVLGTLAPTFRSWRNYNDRLGLPLSLGRLEPTHRFAVLELGADHPGEIAQLCGLLHPTVGVVTNVSPVHLQYFGSVTALADELAQLPAALPADGFAMLNYADPATRAMGRRGATPAQVRYFAPVDGSGGTLNDLAVQYAVEPLGSDGRVRLALRPAQTRPEQSEPLLFTHLHGNHWADSVLAALTVGTALGVDESEAVAALRDLCPLPGRMRWLGGKDGMTLLDDSHNAAPASAAAGLEALDAIARTRSAPRIAVLGDMLRLGDADEEEHRRLGQLATVQSDYVVTRGLRAEVIADAALRAGLAADRVAVTHTAEDAAAAVRAFAASGQEPVSGDGPTAVVYVKGSEEMRMEQVTGLLLADPNQAEQVLDRQTQAWQRVVVMRPDRPTWLEVDLSAIARNTQLVSALVGPAVRVLVSLKADAYGHGALRVARTVLRNGASWLGVATVSEAEPLRAAGVTAPILVFGYTAPWQAREAVRLDLRVAVYSLDTARALSQAAIDLGGEVRVHTKVDTGMARLGLRAEDTDGIIAFCEALRALPGLRAEGIFTHFATADSADQRYAHRQLDRFNSVLAALDAHGLRPPLVHAANSAALLRLPEAHFDMVRPGVAIYGLPPSDEVRLPEEFRPALAFKTQVAQVKWIPAGEGVSYGATYVTSAPTRIAVLPVGYADGFRRAPATWGEVLVRGQRAPLVGRVCMDQCMIDVTHVAGVRQGDEVVLIGRQGDDALTAEQVAGRLGTIAYEVVAALLARVPRVS
jgi:Alr-MurF fusion protein